MFTRQLGRLVDQRGHSLSCISLHPGVVYTELYVNVWWMKIFSLAARWVVVPAVTPHCTIPMLCRLVMKTPEQGGDTLVHAALDPALATPAMQGHHLENHRVTRYGDDDNDL